MRFNCFLLLALILARPGVAWTQGKPHAASAEDEVRQAAQQYDAALRGGDTTAVGRFWAAEYTFVNPSGARLTRAARMANLLSGFTALDTIGRQVRDEQIRVYGNLAVHTTRIVLGGRYSRQVQRGDYQALVVWVRRGGRWQQVASQLTPVAAP